MPLDQGSDPAADAGANGAILNYMSELEQMLARFCQSRRELTGACRGTELEAILVALLAYEKCRLSSDGATTTEIAKVAKIKGGNYVSILKKVEEAFQVKLVARVKEKRGSKNASKNKTQSENALPKMRHEELPENHPGGSTILSFDQLLEEAKEDHAILRSRWKALDRARRESQRPAKPSKKKPSKSEADAPNSGATPHPSPAPPSCGDKPPGASVDETPESIANQLQQVHDRIDTLGRQAKAANRAAAALRRIVSGARSADDKPAMLTIHIGAGMVLIPRFVPEVVRDFRWERWKEAHGYPEDYMLNDSHAADATGQPKVGGLQPFEIVVSHAKPGDLQLECDAGNLDLVITSFSQQDLDTFAPQVESSELNMHLLFDRQSPVALPREGLEADEFKKIIAGKRLIIPGRTRTPSLRPTGNLCDTAREVLETDIWFEALAMIKSSSDTCCIAFPQLFPADVRSRYKSCVLKGSEFPKLMLGVMRSRIANRHNTRAQNQVIDDLQNKFAKEIQKIAAETLNSEKTSIDLRHTLHLTKYRDAHRWVLGEIKDLVITPDGYLRGTHRLEPNEEGKIQEFSINGHLSVRDGNQFLVWRGYEEKFYDDQVKAEVYSATLSRPAGAMGPMIGSWSGRSDANGIPYIGYLVLFDDPLNDKHAASRRGLVEEIRQLIRAHKRAIDLQLKLPRKRILGLKNQFRQSSEAACVGLTECRPAESRSAPPT